MLGPGRVGATSRYADEGRVPVLDIASKRHSTRRWFCELPARRRVARLPATRPGAIATTHLRQGFDAAREDVTRRLRPISSAVGPRLPTLVSTRCASAIANKSSPERPETHHGPHHVPHRRTPRKPDGRLPRFRIVLRDRERRRAGCRAGLTDARQHGVPPSRVGCHPADRFRRAASAATTGTVPAAAANAGPGAPRPAR